MRQLPFLITAALLSIAVTAHAAEKVGVFVFAKPAVPARTVDGFVDPGAPVSTALIDSVRDLQSAFFHYSREIKNLKTNKDAGLLVEIISREQTSDGAYVVHARATYKDHAFDLTGSSTHQWKESALEIAAQLRDWITANRAKLTER